MKRLALFLATFAAFVMVLALPAGADDETVNATVSLKVISLSVSTNSLSYGALAVGDTDKVPDPVKVTVTNNGSVVEDFKIKGGSSTPGNWTLTSDAPGPDTYRHKFNLSSTGTFTPLGTNSAVLQNDIVATTGAIDVFFMLDMPSTSSSPAQQTLPIVITALESTASGSS
jgi:hypothetical protein